MGDREPALLVLLIQPVCRCWHAGGIRLSGEAIPLLRSERDSLTDYQGMEFDAQLSFLRHHFAGVLQRGCDRFFGRKLKANHLLLIADGHFLDAPELLTQRLAEHFVDWMIQPPASYLLGPQGFVPRLGAECPLIASDLQLVAGELPSQVTNALTQGLPKLVARLHDPDCWECVARPRQVP